MGRGRRHLVLREVSASAGEHFVEDQPARYAACPEAAQYSDEEAEDFLQVAHYLDSVDAQWLVKNLREARITFPIELAYDEYRLGRHLLHRWGDRAVREALLPRCLHVDLRAVAKLRRTGGAGALITSIDRYGAPSVLSTLRWHGAADLIPQVLAALSPKQTARRQALLLCTKVLMHQFLTEPEPPRRPSRWEQQKLARRIRLRDVQLRAMRRSVYALRRERKALLTRVRETGRQKHPELDALATELAQLRAARAEAGRQHAAAMAKQARRYREEISRAQAELASAAQEYRNTLAMRSGWPVR